MVWTFVICINQIAVTLSQLAAMFEILYLKLSLLYNGKHIYILYIVCYSGFGNKNVDIQLSAHDTFLE
jgi:hypothetical protein